MKTEKSQLRKIENRIGRIKKQLLLIGEMRPGSISKQYNVCGTPNCKCKDKDRPKKHGPYYQLSYIRNGKSSSQFIRPQFLADTKKQIASFRRFRRLTEEWIDLALEYAKIKLEISRKIV